MHLDYTGVRVRALAPSLRFFERALGLRVVRRGTMDHGGRWVLLEDPTSHQRLELNWYPRGNRFATPFERGESLDHLGFRVQDLRAATRRVEKAGAVKVAQVPARGRPEVVFLEGPDGIWIELIQSPGD
ncbi:MAG TPA: VOC family protein [Thermoplasmata archaeon]|nr:VOC family protein [Thermoplasmata archaeon]